MQLTFHGGRELVQRLRQLPRAVRERVLVGAMLAGGGIIQQDAAAHAPRDPNPNRRRGKRLADSIKTVVTEQTPSGVTVNVMTRDPVAHLVEFGHRVVPRGPNRRKVSVTRVSRTGRITTKFQADPTEQRQRRPASNLFVAPKPFLRPAFEANKEAMLAKIGAVIGAGIEAEAQRLATTNVGSGFVTAPGLTGVV